MNGHNENDSMSADNSVIEPRYIVGIGASAGGLEALQQLLSELSPNTGFPYIIVQHLSPDYKSLLAEILTKYTDMPVFQAENAMNIEPNCVYLIPPKNNMRLANGKLFLTEQKDGVFNHPIDIFFRSLAEDAKQRAIAIVLSGTGSDGTNGIKDIKEQDGLIIVQSSESAKFDGMPKSALRTGLVDTELSPKQIAAEIQHISTNVYHGKLEISDYRKVDEDVMRRVYYILKKVSNINFTYYKQTTILRRIERRMVLTHMERINDYVNYLFDNPDEVKILSKEVLIGVTSFFRDPEYFEILKKIAIFNIVKNIRPNETIRVWVTGCSTGEEAYSVAILFSEVMDELNVKREIKIFATDLDVEAIAIAGRGVYSESICETVSSARLSRFFSRKNNTYIINREIRRMIVFSPHNVFQDPPFGKLDLISCRNMLIYFQPVLQRDLFSIFHSSLKDKAYLFLGKSEAIGEYSEVFIPKDTNAKIFCHRTDGRAPKIKSLPFMQSNSDIDAGFLDSDFDDECYSERRSVINEFDTIDTQLLERFMPACVVVNDKNEIEHTYGENSNFLHFSIGRASLSLFDTLTEDLKIATSTILKEARNSRHTVGYKDVRVRGEHSDAIINLTAMPVSMKKTDPDSGLIALIFSEIGSPEVFPDAQPYQIDRVSSQRITDLEQELKELQEKLKTSMAEQETVNEELQAANEELLTANEELQSSNEELQSVNEELYTVNAEYQQKMAELGDMNDDIANFLSTTLIGIMFVDNDLNIRRFTNYVTSEFGVMEHDIGRSIKFITYNFIDVNLIGICNKVLKTLTPVEREILANTQKAYFLRVAPYRTTENKMLGLVITLVDLSAQKADQKLLKNANVALDLANQANHAKSDFLSRMSHEIRTPMNAIAGMAEIARKNPDNTELAKDCLKKTARAVKYMNSIVMDILEMSKIEQSRIELEYKPFSLTLLVENLESMLRSQSNEAGLSFTITLPNNCSPIYFGDETRLQQILINFLTNAIKYTPEGGDVSLDIAQLENVNGKAKMCFTVSDTGIGIEESFLPELFKPFSRGERTVANTTSSIGLGLSIAHNLVSLMNGYIEVESKINQGSTFIIYLTIDTMNANENIKILKSGNDNNIDYHLQGLNVLIAEDNEMNMEILENILDSQGIICTLATDGVEAVSKYLGQESGFFDCILMDIRMPKLDGREATKKIRSSGREDAADIPIIGVSAEDMQGFSMAELNDFITKPIDTKELFEKLHKYCIR